MFVIPAAAPLQRLHYYQTIDRSAIFAPLLIKSR
jgi:hypothetical protein